ncbi:diaminobutyrate acetyltransferase [Sulfuriflexus sp.]|uniref:diaminobutyrate acetyltransferase n=1 Tax=Sulfuriflexus sp. TaxID=2015443 RepID=UPI0028CE4201|nr:diaminobutyrate acetyltransferase [Sulfuriflexus sp.]MDT8403234.1 diaminobutyrate acetyltransferase [Sulfuriflexus sp.]
MPQTIELRPPAPEDGISVFRLVEQCPPLDQNSVYCNLLQCTHFATTSVAAVMEDELVGFISGYRLPERPETLFIWQVAVGEKARGQGLATRMLQDILERADNADVAYIETTITESNKASWALFEKLAQKLDTGLTSSLLFDRQRHFDGKHDSEMLVRIGPFK